MILLLIIIIVATYGILLGVLLALGAAAKRGDQQLHSEALDPYELRRRRERYERAMRRFHGEDTPLGHVRLGIDHPINRRRGV